MASDFIVDSVGHEIEVSVVFLGDVIGKLRLIEIDFAIVAVPGYKVFEGVLNCQAVGSDVVSVHFDADVIGVL